jgi:peptide chain release factor 2
LKNTGGVFKVADLKNTLEELASKLEEPNAMSDNEQYIQNCQAYAKTLSVIENFNAIEEEILFMAELHSCKLLDESAEHNLDGAISKITSALDSRHFSEEDDSNCFVEIHSGAGGTEAQDWVTILLRMYARFCESLGLSVELVSSKDGDRNTVLKNAILKVSGPMATGWLKTETGVHRLIRNSPFDSANRRHTSFASVSVYPEVKDRAEITVQPKDIRVDTYRSGGAGGQNVNKVSSAVRITHLESGIVTQSQSERSQHQNKQIAMEMLISKLHARQAAVQQTEAQKVLDEQADVSFGHQIRSYVLSPFQMIKDNRTGVETSNSRRVLDGDIKEFILAALKLEEDEKQ